MSEYFGRSYELTISNAAQRRTFSALPGVVDAPLQITFSIDQTPGAHRAYGEITIYGLKRSSRRDIYEQFSDVTLKAGFGESVGTIFAGQIENVEIGRDGPNPYVKLFCQAGAAAWQGATISRTFGQDTPQIDIIRAVAESFGAPVEFIGDFSALPKALKGRTMDGDSKYYMNQMAESFEFDWFLGSSGMVIAKQGADRPDFQTFNYKPTNGLIGSPEITQRGVNVEVVLNPFVRPYDRYTVESETGQLTFNGVYYQSQQFPPTNGESLNQVLSYRHEGDFYGDTWQTSLEGRRLDG